MREGPVPKRSVRREFLNSKSLSRFRAEDGDPPRPLVLPAADSNRTLTDKWTEAHGLGPVEWVDGGEPDDASAPPNFGWRIHWSDPPMEPVRLALLLRALAESLQQEVQLERDEPNSSW